MLGADGSGVDAHLSTGLGAGGSEALGEDAIAVARAAAFPGGHVAAVVEGDDRRAVLLADNGGIDAGFAADLGAIGIIALQVGAPVGAVLTEGRPCHHIAAVFERGDFRAVLLALGVGIDPMLRAELGAIGIVALGTDVDLARAGFHLPGDHVSATGQRGDHRVFLFSGGGGVDLCLPTNLGAARVVALGVDVIAADAALVAPDRDVTAIGKGCDRHFVLVTGGGGVDTGFAEQGGRHVTSLYRESWGIGLM
ncbi:hypothetical protein D3C79_764100 [compost metagenome]